MRDSVSNGGANSDSDSKRARHSEGKKRKKTNGGDGWREGMKNGVGEGKSERKGGRGMRMEKGGGECGRNSHK